MNDNVQSIIGEQLKEEVMAQNNGRENAQGSDVDFAPRRRRADRGPMVSMTEVAAATDVVPMTDKIREDMLRHNTWLCNVQENERQAIDRYNREHARAELLADRVDLLERQLAEANKRCEVARDNRTALGMIIENIGGLIADGIEINKKADEP